MKFQAPAKLLSSSRDHRQAQSGTLSHSFGGEERLGCLRQSLSVHADAFVGDDDLNTGIVLQPGLLAFLWSGVLCRDCDFASIGHGITRINRKVYDRKFELVRIGKCRLKSGRKPIFEFNRRPERTAQQFRHASHKVGDVNRPRSEILLSRKSEHSLRERNAPLRPR